MEACEHCETGKIVELDGDRYCNECGSVPDNEYIATHVPTMSASSLSIKTASGFTRNIFFGLDTNNSKEDLLAATVKEYSRIIGSNPFPQQAISESAVIFNEVRTVSNRQIKNRNRMSIMAAILFLQCNHHGQSRSVTEISEIFGIYDAEFLIALKKIYALKLPSIKLLSNEELDHIYLKAYIRDAGRTQKELDFLLAMYQRMIETRFFLFYCAHSKTKCNGIIYIIDRSVPSWRYYNNIRRHSDLFTDILIEHDVPLPSDWTKK